MQRPRPALRKGVRRRVVVFTSSSGDLRAGLGASGAQSNAPTSPLAGKWTATSKLGKLTLTTNAAGENVTEVDLVLFNWKCGGAILTSQLNVGSTWPISDSQVSVDFFLDSDQQIPRILDGTYNKKHKSLSGDWQGEAYGTTCSGIWQAAAAK